MGITTIRNNFTDELQRNNFRGRDFAEITRAMKRWLNLDEDLTKWNYKQDTNKIADAEEKAISIIKLIPFRNKTLTKLACFLACKI